VQQRCDENGRSVLQLPIDVNLNGAAMNWRAIPSHFGGEPHSASSYPRTIYQSVASLVRIILFAAAPFGVSEAHRRATSHGITRFSGRRVYPQLSPKTVCRRRDPCELTEPNATPLRQLWCKSPIPCCAVWVDAYGQRSD